MLLFNFLPCDTSFIETKELLFGVEYEIEGIDYISQTIKNTFSIVSDGSLRNNGVEFVSQPNPFARTLLEFQLLHNKRDLTLYENPFSPRTSIHVHVNCQNLKINIILNIIKGYILTEKFFFSFVGDVRRNSIYCVPLYDTNLSRLYNLGLGEMVVEWHKYTAFNIVRLSDIGTIEFRHLYGTDNFLVFSQWLQAIRELFLFFISNPEVDFFEELTTNRLNFVKLICPLFTKGLTDDSILKETEDSFLDLLKGYV